MKISKTYSFSTGWYGRATEHGHSAKSTKVHLLVNGKPVCGYKPHKTMQFQWCSYSTMYIECDECKKRALEFEWKGNSWVKKLKTTTKETEVPANQNKLFHEWIRKTFTWVDNDVKAYMRRSWSASYKANKANKK